MIKFFKRNEFVISLILAFVGLGYAFYEHYNPLRMSINYFILESFNVVNIKKPVSDLDISFKGENIRKDSLNLKFYKIQLINDGEQSIDEFSYAKEIPFGFQVKNGRVVSLNYNSTEDFIQKNIQPKIVDSNKVVLGKIIFDEGKSVEFEILVLHKSHETPTLTSLGKIAGINQITIQTKDYDTVQNRFLDLINNLKRNYTPETLTDFVVMYGVLVFVFLILVYIWIDNWREKLKEKKKRKAILDFYEHPLKDLTHEQLAMVKLYMSVPQKDFKDSMSAFLETTKVKEIVSSELGKKKIVDDYIEFAKTQNQKTNEVIEYTSSILIIYDILNEYQLIEKFMVKHKFIEEIKRILNSHLV